MKLLSFFLGAALVAMIRGQTECDFDYVCNDQGAPEDLPDGVASPFACYTACKAYNDANSGAGCEFWTYYKELGNRRSFDEENDTELDNVDEKLRATGKAVCRRLNECEHMPASQCNGEKCASGPGSCEKPYDFCSKPNWGSGSAMAHWTCDVDMPYRKADIPKGTRCFTKCPAFVNGEFTEATCESNSDQSLPGTWKFTDSTITEKDGTSISVGNDPKCECDDILLKEHQWPAADGSGSTNEVGASFFCTNLKDSDSDGRGDTLESATKCKLFCNGHLAMDIKCNTGIWTAGVTDEKDIYCWGPPLDCYYNPGVNSDVCTCTDDPVTPTVSNICAAGEGCLTGNCLTACVPSPTAISTPCFCETLLGGEECGAGSICDNDTCS